MPVAFCRVGQHVEFNPYYEHENNTGRHKNHPENAVGLALYLFFSPTAAAPLTSG